MPMETRAPLRVISPSLPSGVQNRNTQSAQRRRVELPSEEVRKLPGRFMSSSLHATAFPSGVMRASVLLLPPVVNCNSRLFDKFSTPTSHWPVRLDRIAILFPSAETDSMTVLEIPSVNARRSPVSLPVLGSSGTRYAFLLRVRLEKTTRPALETAGDASSEVPVVERRGGASTLPGLGSMRISPMVGMVERT